MKTKNVSFLGFVFAVVGAVLAASGCDNDSTSAKTVIEGGILYREVERTVPTLEIVEKSEGGVYIGYKFDAGQDPDTLPQPLTAAGAYDTSWNTWGIATDGENTVYSVTLLSKSAVTKFPYTAVYTFESKYRLAQGFNEDGTVLTEQRVTLEKEQAGVQVAAADFPEDGEVGKTPINGGWVIRRTVPSLVIIPGSVTDTSVLVGYEVPANEDSETAISALTSAASGSSTNVTLGDYYDKGNLADIADDRTYKAVSVAYPGRTDDVRVTFVSEYTKTSAGSTTTTATKTVSLAVPKTSFAAKATTIRAVAAADVKVYSGKAGDTNTLNGGILGNGLGLSSITGAVDAQRRIDVTLPLDNSNVGYVKYRYKYAGDSDWAYNMANVANSRFAYSSQVSGDNDHLGVKTAKLDISAGTRYKVAATSTIKGTYGSMAFPGAPTGSTLTNYQVSGVDSLPSIVTSASADGYVTGTGNSVNNRPVWQIGSTYSTTADGTITTFVGIDGTTYRNTTGGTNPASTGVTTTSGYIGNAVAKSVSTTVSGTTYTTTVYVPVTVTQSQDIPTTVELKYAIDNDGKTETASSAPYAVTLSGYTEPTTSGFSVVR
jgi:hypothetical protein